MIRTIYFILLIVLLPIVPWWLLGALTFLGIIFFRQYFEALAIVFFYDLCFGLPGGGWFGTQFTFTIIFLIVFLLVEGYKDRLIFYG